MNIFKSHFWYHKRQRNGIFFLVLIIIALQTIYAFVDFSSKELIEVNNPELIAFQKQIDSLKILEIEKRKPKLYLFNPNYINDYKGAQLGMSIKEIDRLIEFREGGKFVNSVNEFQKVTKVSDSLLTKIAPRFKFPDWVVKRNQQSQLKKGKIVSSSTKQSTFKKIKPSTIDLNAASAVDFELINGVDERLAERIVKYRTKLKGFSVEEQLYEVWKIDKELADGVLSTFKILKTPVFEKINLNTATFKEVLANPYINYELCKKIFEYRDEVAELQSLEELRNINNFPLNKYDRIALYLFVK